jgi:hypothetical protein
MNHPILRGRMADAVRLERTAARVWKRLTREERLAAAEAFFEEPGELAGAAARAIAEARHLRPQVARALPVEEQARALGLVLDPGELLASSLLVALHLRHRRPLLRAFLDAAALPHEDGVLKDEESSPSPLSEEAARHAVAALAAFPPHEALTYLNTLWLQDPDRWAALEAAVEALSAAGERR